MMRRPHILLYVLLLASVIIPTLPRLVEMLRIARELWPLPIEARREKLMPESYAAIEKIRREVPPNERIALVGVSRPSLDEALFVNYYLYPHPTNVLRSRIRVLRGDGVRRVGAGLQRQADSSRILAGESTGSHRGFHSSDRRTAGETCAASSRSEGKPLAAESLRRIHGRSRRCASCARPAANSDGHQRHRNCHRAYLRVHLNEGAERTNAFHLARGLAVIGLLITALLFPLAGCITGRRPLAECFQIGRASCRERVQIASCATWFRQ